jgi:hypothetical protein
MTTGRVPASACTGQRKNLNFYCRGIAERAKQTQPTISRSRVVLYLHLLCGLNEIRALPACGSLHNGKALNMSTKHKAAQQRYAEMNLHLFGSAQLIF